MVGERGAADLGNSRWFLRAGLGYKIKSFSLQVLGAHAMRNLAPETSSKLRPFVPDPARVTQGRGESWEEAAISPNIYPLSSKGKRIQKPGGRIDRRAARGVHIRITGSGSGRIATYPGKG